jgi:hypothetical protein
MILAAYAVVLFGHMFKLRLACGACLIEAVDHGNLLTSGP